MSENVQENAVVQNEAAEEGMTLMQLLHIIKIRFWIAILCVIVAVIAAAVYLTMAVPVYESTASALVSPITNTSSLESLMGTATNSSKISTEVELITSETNLDSALAMLNLHDYVNSDGLHYDEVEFPVSGSSLIKGSKVSVTTVKDTNVVNVTVSDPNPQFCADLVNAILASYSQVLTTIAKNSKTAQRVFLEEQIPLNEQSLAEATQKLSDFKQQSGILQITEKNQILSTNVSRLQLQEEPLLHQQVEQLALYEGYLAQLEAKGFQVSALESFAADESINASLDKIFGWYQELLMYQALGLTDDSDSSNTSRIYVLNSSISSSQKDVLSVVTNIIREQVPAGDALTLQLKNLYSQVVVQLLMIEENVKAIDSTKEYYLDELSQFPELERQSEELLRNVTVFQSLGVTLREMYEEARLLEAAISGYVTPIDEGKVPTIPVSPKKMMILAVAVLLGGCLGILIELYVNYKDITIHDSDTVRQLLGPTVPELGWVPLLNSSYREKYGSMLVSLALPNSFVAERISVIASNTIYSTDSSKMKVIGVNSSAKGEGKTSLVCNLAVSYAEMGKRVLLIDGDLRNPSTEKGFGLKRASRGISDLVVNRAKLEEVLIRPVAKYDNLHMLCAGHVTKNPAMIFNSEVFHTFLNAARSHYDLVLVDSPPVSVSPEFATIVSHFDGIIINIRAGITNKQDLASLIGNLKLIGSTLVGFVYAGVIVNDKRSSYSYSSSSGYSYNPSNYSADKSDADSKVLMRTRAMNKTYRKVYEKDLNLRGKTVSQEKLVDPVYLKDCLKTAPAAAGASAKADKTEVPPAKAAPAAVDPLSAIEADEDAVGQKRS